jgi:CRISPR-associated protein Csb2
MNSVLCITLRYLDPEPRFHGRGDDGVPEWPPSPLRLYQALVCAAASRWREHQFQDYARPALQWLEPLTPTVVVPSVIAESFGYRMYVPNNSGDLMTAAWARGDTDTSMAKFRVEKDVRPIRLTGDAIRFLFPLTDGTCPHFEVLRATARSVTHLGWGIDMVAGNAELLTDEQAMKLSGDVWRPASDSSGTPLRTSEKGTLDALLTKHRDFLSRLPGGSFKPVPPLSAFRVVGYRRATDAPGRPWVAFSILKPDLTGNAAFHTGRKCRDVAAWVRHVTAEVCQPWADRAAFVHGHDDAGNQLRGDAADHRFMYLPLPTINAKLRRVESVRRVLLAAPAAFADRIDWVRKRLPGQELVTTDGEVVGVLNLLPTSDWVLRQYTGTAHAWSTVTPVVWPGYDDNDQGKARDLLLKAFRHAGLSAEVVAGIEELEWRSVGFRPGLDLAGSYRRPEKLTGRAYHVRVRFKNKVAGPLAVGAGRYRGLGLFATEDPP